MDKNTKLQSTAYRKHTIDADRYVDVDAYLYSLRFCSGDYTVLRFCKLSELSNFTSYIRFETRSSLIDLISEWICTWRVFKA